MIRRERMKKLLSVVIAVVLVSALLMACTAQPATSGDPEPAAEPAAEEPAAEPAAEEPAADSDDTITIGFSNWSRGFEFYTDMEVGLQEKADELGIEIIMQDPDGDLAEQTKQLENYIARGVDGVIVVPIDSEASADEIKMVNDAGIPLITIDIAATGGGEVLSHIASDNYLGGVLAAEFMGEELGGAGTVAIINNPTITPLIDRENGFKDTLAEKYPDIEIVSVQSGESQREKGLEVAENILQKETDLGGIFGVNDMMALGALQAVQAKNMDTVVIGFDATEEARTAIKGDTPMKASIAQKPKLLGATGIEVMMNILNGQSVEALIEVEVETITIDNVDNA
jgi:ribose transport system substrate-binding protein